MGQVTKKWIIGCGVLALLIAAFFLYKNYNPTQSELFPQCPSKYLTGYDCPGCGTQRAAHAFFNGDFYKAFWFNPLLFILIPFAALLAVFEYTPALKSHPWRQRLNHPWVILGLFAIIICFTVWRNL